MQWNCFDKRSNAILILEVISEDTAFPFLNTHSAEETWTRDPFDRLIVAHARLRRVRLATGDGHILERLRPSERVEL